MQQSPRHRSTSPRATRRVQLLVAAVAVIAIAVVALSLTGFSSATFTAATKNASTVTAAADWTPPTVAVQAPATFVKGSVTLTATATDADSGVQAVAIQYQAVQGSAWVTVCSDTTTLFACAWDTLSVANGAYDVRAVATDKAGNTATSSTARTTVDNLAPAVAMTDPGTPLSGTRTFAATATDTHSGVAQVVVQHQVSGSSTWTTLCTVAAAPFSCSVDTTTLAGGTYSFRAVATDRAGNTSTSATVANRVVDNNGPSVVLTDPGSPLFGTVTLTATPKVATSTTVDSVKIQRAPAGSSTWTDICSDTSAPFTCAWNTTQTTDGSYDLRAVVTDKAGRTATSAVVTARVVDNLQLKGVDVQTTNGGTAGMPDAGDTIVYTFNRAVNLGTVLAGWNGSATTVPVRLSSGLLFSNSSLTVSGVNLGAIAFDVKYHTILSTTTTFPSTMTADSVTVNGVSRTIITLRLGAASAGGGNIAAPAGNATMTWTPVSTVTDLLGRASATTAVVETGTADRDF